MQLYPANITRVTRVFIAKRTRVTLGLLLMSVHQRTTDSVHMFNGKYYTKRVREWVKREHKHVDNCQELCP